MKNNFYVLKNRLYYGLPEIKKLGSLKRKRSKRKKDSKKKKTKSKLRR